MKNHKIKFRLNTNNWLTVTIMALSGAVATFLYLEKNTAQQTSVTAPDENNTKNLESAIYSSNIERTTEECKKLVSNQSSIVIFEHGTCVRVVGPIEDLGGSALSSLAILANPSISFVIKPLSNNDYLIVFDEYLFCWAFAKDIAKIKDSLLTDSRLAASENDPETVKSLPEFQRRIGKLARLLVLKDAKSQKIIRILKADTPK